MLLLWLFCAGLRYINTLLYISNLCYCYKSFVYMVAAHYIFYTFINIYSNNKIFFCKLAMC